MQSALYTYIEKDTKGRAEIITEGTLGIGIVREDKKVNLYIVSDHPTKGKGVSKTELDSKGIIANLGSDFLTKSNLEKMTTVYKWYVGGKKPIKAKVQIKKSKKEFLNAYIRGKVGSGDTVVIVSDYGISYNSRFEYVGIYLCKEVNGDLVVDEAFLQGGEQVRETMGGNFFNNNDNTKLSKARTYIRNYMY